MSGDPMAAALTAAALIERAEDDPSLTTVLTPGDLEEALDVLMPVVWFAAALADRLAAALGVDRAEVINALRRTAVNTFSEPDSSPC